MKPVDKRIASFIRRHHVLTLATSADGELWCSNMFYAYDPARNIFVFTSDATTRHIEQAMANNIVAASIVLETRVVGRLKGLQLTGRIRHSGDDEAAARKLYLKRFPYAAVAELNLWIIEPSYYKFTDNTLGFGKKLIWQADE